MNRSIVQGNWKQLKGKVKAQWGKLFIIPPAPTGYVADFADLALRTSDGPSMDAKRRQKTELDDWENEGGSLAAPTVAPQLS